MLKINRKVEYALMALKYMSEKQNDGLTTGREICQTFSIPFDTTSKVLQLMNQGEILKSVKGIKGGYSLNRPLNEISFSELTSLIEEKEFSNHCESESGNCDYYQSCNIISPIEKLNRKLIDFFSELKLEDLFYNNYPTPPNINSSPIEIDKLIQQRDIKND
jgi:Rrf2 family protein